MFGVPRTRLSSCLSVLGMRYSQRADAYSLPPADVSGFCTFVRCCVLLDSCIGVESHVCLKPRSENPHAVSCIVRRGSSPTSLETSTLSPCCEVPWHTDLVGSTPIEWTRRPCLELTCFTSTIASRRVFPTRGSRAFCGTLSTVQLHFPAFSARLRQCTPQLLSSTSRAG